MECNKDEAIKAKEIAENKMRNNDFAGGRKFALKAQQLYPDVDNISQMLVVCDLHCSAQKKLSGNEMNWYSILQIDHTADEATIKKQYRKFALQLHPDKNKFPGAESAFKLIGEAQRVLLDKGKRSIFDLKVKAFVSKPAATYRAPQKPTCKTNVGTQNSFSSNYTNVNVKCQMPQHSSAQQRFSGIQTTFWTSCHFCKLMYQYDRQHINKTVLCQTCKKPFIASETARQSVPMATNFVHPSFPPKKNVPVRGTKQASEGNSTNSNSKTVFPEKTGNTSENGNRKVNTKRRRKQLEESSESCDTESSSDSEIDEVLGENGDFQAGQDFGSDGGRYPRRSGRQKQQVSYKENLSDDDELDNPKRAKKSEGEEIVKEVHNVNEQSYSASAVQEEKTKRQGSCFEESLQNGQEGTQKVDGKETVEENGPEDGSGAHVEPAVYEYPDPDFNDFDKDRKEECFAVGQIWGIYDTLDAMPRFYARIAKVFSPGFKLRITWLEPDPDDKNEIKWVKEGLPVSCCRFGHGDSELTKDLMMFSHLVSWEKGSNRYAYKIFPKKGQTWALFKDWDFSWKSHADDKPKYEYEIVEILSDYIEGVGTSVTYLAKLKGYACVFCRKSNERGSYQIPARELFRFSHRIPSVKLTGEEREGVIKGSFELDPASLPPNLEEIAPGNLEAETRIPKLEFCDFVAKKSMDKFEVGQIWSLYSDEDGLPKNYCQIMKIDTNPIFKLRVRQLVSCALPNVFINWLEKDMPVSCGRFKMKKGKSLEYNSTDPFSQQLKVEPCSRNDEYDIFPRKGEVWALYRDWTEEMKLSDLKNCEYDIVELLEEDDSQIEVLLLELVAGSKSVFRPQLNDSAAVTIKIPQVQLLRFSHQIPAFRLTEEQGGTLRGFWELDPAALPIH